MATTAEEVKNLKKDIGQIKNMLADQLNGSAQNGKSDTIFNRDDIEDMANRAGKSVREFMTDKREKFTDATDQAEAVIKDRPFASAAAMFAGGMLFAALLRRR